MKKPIWLAMLMLALAALACSREAPPPVYTITATPPLPDSAGAAASTLPALASDPAAEPQHGGGALDTPTPNPTRPPAPEGPVYVVQPNDTLLDIALFHNTNIPALIALNSLAGERDIYTGLTLKVPGPPTRVGPAFKIIPDSELVYGPALQDFNTRAFVARQRGYLRTHSEDVYGVTLTGAEVVERAAVEYSVSPRLLLALLEYQAGWLTNPAPTDLEISFPMGVLEGYNGLYRQLSWAANKLNEGYYGWRYRGLSATVFPDGARLAFAPELNAGTVAVQHLLAQTQAYTAWLPQVGPNGFFAAFVNLFGSPFAYAVDPLIPPDLAQPELALPWAEDETWYYTGGPHGAWASGSGWSAVDLAPPGEQMGCYVAESLTRAVAPGVIARSENGAVWLDLDGDGFEGTGWVILYLHLSNRVEAGTRVDVGDPVGQASCEGGVSYATHLHIARKYNGEWIPADCHHCRPEVAVPPFVMGGWTVGGFLGREYDGFMTRGDDYREAFDGGRVPLNSIGW